MRLLFISLISFYFLVGFIPNKVNANDFDLTIITTNNGDLDILQDGEDNNIDLDVQSMNNFELDFSQKGHQSLGELRRTQKSCFCRTLLG